MLSPVCAKFERAVVKLEEYEAPSGLPAASFNAVDALMV